MCPATPARDVGIDPYPRIRLRQGQCIQPVGSCRTAVQDSGGCQDEGSEPGCSQGQGHRWDHGSSTTRLAGRRAPACDSASARRADRPVDVSQRDDPDGSSGQGRQGAAPCVRPSRSQRVAVQRRSGRNGVPHVHVHLLTRTTGDGLLRVYPNATRNPFQCGHRSARRGAQNGPQALSEPAGRPVAATVGPAQRCVRGNPQTMPPRCTR